MPTLLVEKPGMQTTVQDLGRPGYGPMGVSACGAADPVSLRVANLLVGNPPNTPALEMTLTGGSFRFREGALVAFAGASFDERLNHNKLAPHVAHRIPAGELLTFGSTAAGARCYFAVAGGISVPLFLGSASTHLLSGLGGFQGRALRAGDQLSLGRVKRKIPPSDLSPALLSAIAPRKTLRITLGPQHDSFSAATLRAFLENSFEVTEQSDRLGLRLRGPCLSCDRAGEQITAGVSLGAIQIVPSGDPVVLFVDQQTTGGYPVIANVISADLFCIGQLRPRDTIRFEQVTIPHAIRILRRQERLFSAAERSLA